MVLCDQDELLHRPPDPRPERWQENMFFICWDIEGRNGVLCHIQRVPALGLQEAQVVVAVGGRTVSTSLVSEYRADALAPEFDVAPVVAFREWRFRLLTTGIVGNGPLGFFATRPGDDATIRVDLALTSTLPVVDFAQGLAAMVDGMRTDEDGPQMGDQQHYEQGGTWAGRVRAGDEEVDTAGLFVRDHSWGVRHEQQQFRAFWTASCLDGGRLFCNAIGVPGDSGVIGIGAVASASGVAFTSEVDARFWPAPGIATYDRTTVTFGAPVDAALTATTGVHLPIYLPHSGPNRYDNNAISATRMGDATGFGVMEWASVLSDQDTRAIDAARVAS